MCLSFLQRNVFANFVQRVHIYHNCSVSSYIFRNAIPVVFQQDPVLSPVLAKYDELFGSSLENSSSIQNHNGSSRQNHKEVNVFDSNLMVSPKKN